MKYLAINAVSIAPGGGLNGLIGYLTAWQELGCDAQMTLYASRPAVLDAVRAVRPDIEVIPYAVNASAMRHFALQQFDLGKRIEERRADVVWTNPALLGRCRVPQLVHHRNLKRFVEPHPWRALLSGRIDSGAKDLATRRSLARAGCNVFISHYLREQAEKFVPGSAPRNHVVYNGVSSELIAAAERAEPGWDGRPHLTAVQSPALHKDNPTLLRALRYVLDREPAQDWFLTIAGEGDWSRERALAQELGLAERVRFAGYLSHREMDPLLRQSVCLVFTSVLEGFGNPPIEAMARSCPTIACHVTAMPEVIGDAGTLVEPHREDQFGEAILRLYRDRSLRETLAQRGRQRVRQFRWVDSAARMYALLEATASRHVVIGEPVVNLPAS